MGTLNGDPAGSADPTPSYYTAVARAEESEVWWSWHFTGEDTWFWERIQPGPATATRTYTTDLTALASVPITATVRGEVVSRGLNPNHHTQVKLNGDPQPIVDALWNGRARHAFETGVPQSNLQNGANQIEFVVLYNGDIEDMYFDWFEIEYARQYQAIDNQLWFPGDSPSTWKYQAQGFTGGAARVFDLTDPLNPVKVVNADVSAGTVTFVATPQSGSEYFVLADSAVKSPKSITGYTPEDLSSTSGAEYLFITHPDFMTALQPLADHRTAQGMSTRIVSVEELYNQFNFGIYHPIAIRNFLAYTFANWTTPPTHALLVGDGHWNFKGDGVGQYGSPEPIYMPPNLAVVDPWQGEVDSANLLATLVGDDPLPDLVMGRLPVNSTAELDAVINKITAYESAPIAEWHRRILFVADNTPDVAGDFVNLTESIIGDYLDGTNFAADRIYLDDYLQDPPDDGYCDPGKPCPPVNQAITTTLSTDGSLFVNYSGHASLDRWSHERIFANEDVPTLANGDQLPIVLSMTCLDGYWIYPNQPSLTSDLLRTAGKGAVSTFSATGLGVATGHDELQRGLFTAVFDAGVRDLGLATLAAKLELYASGANFDLLHTFVIFGDPALQVKVPDEVYLPVIRRTD